MRAAGISLTIVSTTWPSGCAPLTSDRLGLGPLACKPLTIGLMVARPKESQIGHGGRQNLCRPHGRRAVQLPCLYLLPRTPRDRNKFVRFKRV